jgi:hypothetical protein
MELLKVIIFIFGASSLALTIILIIYLIYGHIDSLIFKRKLKKYYKNNKGGSSCTYILPTPDYGCEIKK